MQLKQFYNILKLVAEKSATTFGDLPDCSVQNKGVVGAAPTGDAPTTSEWSTIVLPIKVRLILEVWRFR